MEEFNREHKTENQWTRRQIIWNYLTRRTKKEKSEKGMRKLMWLIKNNLCITEVQEGEEGEKVAEGLLEFFNK